MHHKRGKPRSQVRCTLCTDERGNIGGERLAREHDAISPDAVRVTNGKFWDYCPDCDGSGVCECCPNKICVLCGGTKVVDFLYPRSVRGA